MSEPADSFGVPWQGRTLTEQPFAGDDGSQAPEVAAALATWVGADQDDVAAVVAAEMAVMAALAGRRLMVGVVAVLGEGHPLPDHVRGDAGADMALAVLVAADGARRLPVFTSTQALAAWNPSARPVPVEAERAGLAAVAEDCDELLLDVAGPVPFRVPRPALWALAQGRPWRSPAQDDELVAAVQAVTVMVAGQMPALRSAACLPAPLAGLVVVAVVDEGLDGVALDRLTAALGVELGRRAEVAERVANVRLVVRPTR